MTRRTHTLLGADLERPPPAMIVGARRPSVAQCQHIAPRATRTIIVLALLIGGVGSMAPARARGAEGEVVRRHAIVQVSESGEFEMQAVNELESGDDDEGQRAASLPPASLSSARGGAGANESSQQQQQKTMVLSAGQTQTPPSSMGAANERQQQKPGMAELNPDASDTVPVYMQHMTIVLVTLHVSVFVTGLVGNSLVCLSVYRNKSLQTITNYYIVNLAVADFLVILICLPPTVYWDLTLTWSFGPLLCKLVLYLQSISVSVSVLTLTCISIDRWYAICKPLKFCSTKSRAKMTIGLIWLVSLLIASPDVIFLTTRPLYEEDDYVYMDCTYAWPESNTKMYQLCIVVLLFLLPFVLMTISYAQIVNVLWRNETMAESMQNSMSKSSELPAATTHLEVPEVTHRRRGETGKRNCSTTAAASRANEQSITSTTTVHPTSCTLGNGSATAYALNENKRHHLAPKGHAAEYSDLATTDCEEEEAEEQQRQQKERASQRGAATTRGGTKSTLTGRLVGVWRDSWRCLGGPSATSDFDSCKPPPPPLPPPPLASTTSRLLSKRLRAVISVHYFGGRAPGLKNGVCQQLAQASKTSARETTPAANNNNKLEVSNYRAHGNWPAKRAFGLNNGRRDDGNHQGAQEAHCLLLAGRRKIRWKMSSERLFHVSEEAPPAVASENCARLQQAAEMGRPNLTASDEASSASDTPDDELELGRESRQRSCCHRQQRIAVKGQDDGAISRGAEPVHSQLAPQSPANQSGPQLSTAVEKRADGGGGGERDNEQLIAFGALPTRKVAGARCHCCRRHERRCAQSAGCEHRSWRGDQVVGAAATTLPLASRETSADQIALDGAKVHRKQQADGADRVSSKPQTPPARKCARPAHPERRRHHHQHQHQCRRRHLDSCDNKQAICSAGPPIADQHFPPTNDKIGAASRQPCSCRCAVAREMHPRLQQAQRGGGGILMFKRKSAAADADKTTPATDAQTTQTTRGLRTPGGVVAQLTANLGLHTNGGEGTIKGGERLACAQLISSSAGALKPALDSGPATKLNGPPPASDASADESSGAAMREFCKCLLLAEQKATTAAAAKKAPLPLELEGDEMKNCARQVGRASLSLSRFVTFKVLRAAQSSSSICILRAAKATTQIEKSTNQLLNLNGGHLEPPPLSAGDVVEFPLSKFCVIKKRAPLINGAGWQKCGAACQLDCARAGHKHNRARRRYSEEAAGRGDFSFAASNHNDNFNNKTTARGEPQMSTTAARRESDGHLAHGTGCRRRRTTTTSSRATLICSSSSTEADRQHHQQQQHCFRAHEAPHAAMRRLRRQRHRCCGRHHAGHSNRQRKRPATCPSCQLNKDEGAALPAACAEPSLHFVVAKNRPIEDGTTSEISDPSPDTTTKTTLIVTEVARKAASEVVGGSGSESLANSTNTLNLEHQGRRRVSERQTAREGPTRAARGRLNSVATPNGAAQRPRQQLAATNSGASVSMNMRFYKLIESRKKAAKMLIVIVIMFGLCYLPVHFLNTLRVTIGLPQNDITTIASLVSHWLCYFNSAVNPLIYNLMSGKFRHEFANLFFCRWLRRRTAATSNANSSAHVNTMS